ncbi:MAG: TonB-dependent receptor [Acidobacteria bacterium]|nr:TonB-dependent receptor [Acidobacteriota bacterium]
MQYLRKISAWSPNLKLKKLTSLVLTIALMAALWSPVFAQGTTDGTIAGTVADAQGAVISGAKVTAKNTATGQLFTVNTADNGTFRINNVPVGAYDLTIEIANFKKYANPNVQVQLNRVTDVSAILEAGAVSETVTITAGAAAELVEKTSSQLGKSFEERKVIELPIGLDVNTLALLSPNVVTNGAGVVGAGGSVGGNRPRNNSFTLDGIDNNDVSLTGPQIAPIQDAVKEFTILTNQFTAEFGHSSAGQFNTITKSGTNDLHGDAWWYNINKYFRSLDHRFKEQIAAGAQPDQRPRDDFNRIGGDIGGAIIKDKLFYFGAYQYQTRGTAGATATVGAPTAEGYARLSALRGVSPFTLNLLKDHVAPAPVATGSVNVLGATIPVGQLLILVPDFFNLHQWHTNIDYNLSQNDRLYGRFFYDRLRSPLLGGPGAEFNGTTGTDNRLFSLTENHNFTANLINEFRFGYRRQVTSFNVPLTFNDFPGQFPNISIDELGLFVGPNGNAPQSGIANVYQGSDTVSWTFGKHQLKFGSDFRDVIAPSDGLPRGRGEYAYASLERYLQDLKPDGSNGGLRGIGSGFFAGNQWATYNFIQDDFKFRPNLTFNLGLRYEYTSNARDAKMQNLNRIADVEANDPVLQSIRQRTGLDLFPAGLHFRTPKTDKNNFAPRVGFAWAPEFKEGWLHRIFGNNGQSSVRGGFAIAHDVLFQNLVLLALPPQLQSEIDVTSGSGGIYGTDVSFLQNGGIPAGGAVDPALFNDTATARALTGSYIFDTITPYTMSWSLSYQREFWKDWSVELRYLGTRGVHLYVQSRLNGGVPPRFNLPTYFNNSEIPDRATLNGLPSRQDFLNARGRLLGDLGFAGNLTTHLPQGNSTYHGGSLNVKRRLSNGLSVDAAYTFSKNIDDGTNELFTSFVNPRRPQDNFNLRNDRAESVLSRRHRFSLGLIYELPFYKGEHGWLSQVLGNWQVSAIYQTESGQRLDALSFNDANGNFDNAGDRAVLNPTGDGRRGTDVNWLLRNGQVVARGSAPASQVVGYVAQDANAKFIFADTGARATAGRNLLQAAGLNNWDLAFFKRFSITEHQRLELRAELYNAFNHPQFVVDDPFATDYVDVRSPNFQNKRLFSGNPFGTLPAFGLTTDPIAGGNPRVIQMVLRYHF